VGLRGAILLVLLAGSCAIVDSVSVSKGAAGAKNAAHVRGGHAPAEEGHEQHVSQAGHHEGSGEHGHDGQGQGASGHGHKVPPEALAYALCLMGSVVTVMSIFYLVNWDDEDIKANTWQSLSMTVSIFGAVLIYGTLKNLICHLLDVHGHRAEPLVLLFMFLMFFLILQIALHAMMRADHKRISLRATGTILAHITGFSGMYCAAGLQAMPPFNTSAWAMFSVTVGVAAVISGLCAVGGYFRRQVALADDGEIDEEEAQWMDQVEDAENDVYSLCLGFSIMQVIRFSITGEVQAYGPAEHPETVEQFHANWLLAASVAFGAGTVAGTYVMAKLGNQHLQQRQALRTSLNVFSVAMAWCILFWGEWQIYVLGFSGVRIAGLLLVALSLTVGSCALILCLDMIADTFSHNEARGLRTVILSLGLMVGFTWERAFDIGLEDLSSHHGGKYKALTRVLFPTLLVAVVLPAWSKYILPHALVATEHNLFRVRSFHLTSPQQDTTKVVGSRRC